MRAMLLFSTLTLATGWAWPQAVEPGPCDKHQKPFRVPRTELRASVHTIALTPVWLEPAVSDSIRRRALSLDTLLAGHLEAGGFRLVPASVADSVWTAIRDSSGGLYDAATGQPDSARMEAARVRFRATLQSSFGADAILFSSVVVVPAKFDDGSARWDGAKQPLANFGKRFLQALLKGGTYQGETAALSLRTALVRIDGQLLYDNRGGLQVASIPRAGKFYDVPDAELLADPAQLRGSVRIAVCHLVTER
jgi:hypothetical protein